MSAPEGPSLKHVRPETVLSRSYKEGEDWKDTDQLASGDLMSAVRVLQRAEDYISRQ
jgi:hypothetical protein